MNILEQVRHDQHSILVSLANSQRLLDVAETLGLHGAPEISWCYANLYDRRVTLGLENFEAMQSLCRQLVGKVGTMTKGFHEASKVFTVTFTFDGFAFELLSSPGDACRIETVEEEVVLPAQPERIEKRRRFVLQGGCDPLLAPESQEVS